MAVAKSHNLSAAQALLNWQWRQGIVFNPRSMNEAHMREDLAPAVFDKGLLTARDVGVLQSFQPDRCSDHNKWYECCGDVSVQPSIPHCE